MALVFADRVKETSTTTGTGTYTLGGAVTGFQAFTTVGDGNTCFYSATDGTNWEVGLGTYTLAGTTLARTAILSSSISNAAINWGVGSRTIWLDLPGAAVNTPYATGATDATVSVFANTNHTDLGYIHDEVVQTLKQILARLPQPTKEGVMRTTRALDSVSSDNGSLSTIVNGNSPAGGTSQFNGTTFNRILETWNNNQSAVAVAIYRNIATS